VCSLELTLRLTSVAHINELLNDGKQSKVLPMQIETSDVIVTLLVGKFFVVMGLFVWRKGIRLFNELESCLS
jgi:hypothetical protein